MRSARDRQLRRNVMKHAFMCSFVRKAIFIVPTILTLCLLPIIAAAANQQCVVARVPNAKVLRLDKFYAGVAIADNDVWAVGAAANLKTSEPLAEHWDGSTWQVVRTPDIPRSNLYGVAAVSTSDVWAVGDYFDATQAEFLTLAIHWNGSRWNAVPTPNAAPNDSLSGISSVKQSNNLWAVGTASSLGGPNIGFIERWDHAAWSIAYTYQSPLGASFLQSVASTSPRSAWAVGTYTASDGFEFPLALHWDGQAWSQVSTMTLPVGSFQAVSALADDDVWAVGVVPFLHSVKPFVAHWNGLSWTQVPAPTVGLKFATLNGVIALSRDNVWVDGNTYNRSRLDPDSTDIIAHWDGAAWTTLRAPESGEDKSLYGITGLSHAVWSMGFVDPVISKGEASAVTDFSHC